MAARWLIDRGFNQFTFVWLNNSWQIDFKSRSSSDLAIYPDISVTLFDNSVDGGEAKASAFSHSFSTEERFKNAFLRSSIHAGAGVRYCQQDISSGNDGEMLARIILIQVSISSFNCDSSSRGQGVTSIHDQIK